jgi:beta-lactamase superfamily II metal-dependent hydrolase
MSSPPPPTRKHKKADDYMLAEAEEFQKVKTPAELAEEQNKRRKDIAELAKAAMAAKEAASGVVAGYEKVADAFYITFVQMGQGDCAIMTTPAGKTIMVDCGSDATEATREGGTAASYNARVAGVVQGPLHLKGKGLDVLIVTHPNSDHYNKLETALLVSVAGKGTAAVRNYVPIGKAYHSRAITMYSAANYRSAFNEVRKLDGWLTEITKDGNVRSVTLNHKVTKVEPPDEETKETTAAATSTPPFDFANLTAWQTDSAANTALETLLAKTTFTLVPTAAVGTATLTGCKADPAVDELDADGGLLIHKEDNCTVTLLAAGVDYDYRCDGSDDTNRGSIVTLVEVYGKKILICGDATESTEYYLRWKRSDRAQTNTRLQNLTILQAGHHGSDTSSHHEFLNWTNAAHVVVSSGYAVMKDSLPKATIMTRHRTVLNLAVPVGVAKDHAVAMWVTGGGFSHVSRNATQRLHVTGSNGSLCYEIKKDGTVTFVNDVPPKED